MDPIVSEAYSAIEEALKNVPGVVAVSLDGDHKSAEVIFTDNLSGADYKVTIEEI